MSTTIAPTLAIATSNFVLKTYCFRQIQNSVTKLDIYALHLQCLIQSVRQQSVTHSMLLEIIDHQDLKSCHGPCPLLSRSNVWLLTQNHSPNTVKSRQLLQTSGLIGPSMELPLQLINQNPCKYGEHFEETLTLHSTLKKDTTL